MQAINREPGGRSRPWFGIFYMLGFVFALGLTASPPAAQNEAARLSPAAVSVNVPGCQFGEVSRATADARVSTKAQLKEAVASPGIRVIWIENDQVIDLWFADHRREPAEYALTVPPNVTLASGRSPTQLGGVLYFSERSAHPRYMLRLGRCSRVTGLRLQGPSRSREERDDSNVAIIIDGVDRALVDNNEFSDWPGAAINVDTAGNSYVTAGSVRITRNFFHHNLMCDHGYGVDIVGARRNDNLGGYAFIDRNVFNYNRHAVTGEGHPATGYVAKFNVVLSGGEKCGDFHGLGGHFNQHFDMHGYPHGDGGPAGETIDISNNTIRGEQTYYVVRTRPAFSLRGLPQNVASFYGNVLAHDDRNEAISVYLDVLNPVAPNLEVRANQYNVDTSFELAVGDFDGDGDDDVFQATGAVWMYSARGRSDWRVLNVKSERLPRLLFGDFDGNGKTDVFTQEGSQWKVSYDGSGAWIPLPGGSPVDMSQYRVGDFDGDGKTDVFVATGAQFFYSKGGASGWQEGARSGRRVDSLRFGDFYGDGTTDVFAIVDGKWKISHGAATTWNYLNEPISTDLTELVFADFNGDRVTDIARQKGPDYQVSWSGSTEWRPLYEDALKALPLSLTSMLLGDFDDDHATDVLHYERFSDSERGTIDVGERFVISRRGRPPFSIWSRHEMR